jgi:hypothetical protein
MTGPAVHAILNIGGRLGVPLSGAPSLEDLEGVNLKTTTTERSKSFRTTDKWALFIFGYAVYRSVFLSIFVPRK